MSHCIQIVLTYNSLSFSVTAQHIKKKFSFNWKCLKTLLNQLTCERITRSSANIQQHLGIDNLTYISWSLNYWCDLTLAPDALLVSISLWKDCGSASIQNGGKNSWIFVSFGAREFHVWNSQSGLYHLTHAGFQMALRCRHRPHILERIQSRQFVRFVQFSTLLQADGISRDFIHSFLFR